MTHQFEVEGMNENSKENDSNTKSKQFAQKRFCMIALCLVFKVLLIAVFLPSIILLYFSLAFTSVTSEEFEARVDLFTQANSMKNLIVMKISVTGEIFGTNTQPYSGLVKPDLSKFFTNSSLLLLDNLNTKTEDLSNSKLKKKLQNILSINICSEITDKAYWEDGILYRDTNENPEDTCEDELMNSGLETVLSHLLERSRRLESLFDTVSTEEVVNS